jgi:hypothetical protein
MWTVYRVKRDGNTIINSQKVMVWKGIIIFRGSFRALVWNSGENHEKVSYFKWDLVQIWSLRKGVWGLTTVSLTYMYSSEEWCVKTVQIAIPVSVYYTCTLAARGALLRYRKHILQPEPLHADLLLQFPWSSRLINPMRSNSFQIDYRHVLRFFRKMKHNIYT